MSFNTYLNKFAPVYKFFHECVKKNALYFERTDTGVFTRIKPDLLSDTAKQVLAAACRDSASKLEAYLVGRTITDGPKIFRPKQFDLEVMEQMTLNIDFNDYNQPFECVVIEFPDDYLKDKQIHNPQAGEWIYGTQQPREHRPVFAILYCDKKVGILTALLMFSSNLSIKLCWAVKEGMTLEQSLQDFEKGETFKNTLEVTSDEWEVTTSLIRAALNYCLLIDEVGFKKVGPQNPGYYKRLQKHKKGFDLQAHPFVYELNQEVKLFSTVEKSNDLPSEETGRQMPPHHRRGHYRMQACGSKLAERKRIRISPVFVNKHLFLGDLSNTRYVAT